MINFYSTEATEKLQPLIDSINEQKVATEQKIDELNNKVQILSKIEENGEEIVLELLNLCKQFEINFQIDLKRLIDELIQNAIDSLINEFMDILDNETLQRYLGLLKSIYSRFQMELNQYRFLLSQLRDLTDLNSINNKLNEIKLFINGVIGKFKDFLDNVISECVTLVKDTVKELEEHLEPFTIPTRTTTCNIDFLHTDELIDALITNPDIGTFVSTYIQDYFINSESENENDNKFITISVDVYCNPKIEHSTVEITLGGDHTIGKVHSIFDVKHGDYVFDTIVMPDLITDYTNGKFDNLFDLLADTAEDSLNTANNTNDSNENQSSSNTDIGIFTDLLEDPIIVSITEVQDSYDVVSLKDDDANTEDTPNEAQTSLNNIGELVSSLDYNVFYDKETDEPITDYKGHSLLDEIKSNQGINVDTRELFNYFNDSFRIGLLPIEDKDRIYPTVDVAYHCKSSNIVDCADEVSFIISLKTNDWERFVNKRHDLAFPIDKLNTVINPENPTSGDLLTDVLVDIDNYLTDVTSSEDEYETVLKIKEELLLLTKNNISRIKELQKEFGELVTKTTVQEYIYYQQASVNPLCDDNLLCMYGSFKNKDLNIIAFVGLSEGFIEVQYWKWEDRSYKYERLDWVNIDQSTDCIVSFDYSLDGIVMMTVFDKKTIPIELKRYDVLSTSNQLSFHTKTSKLNEVIMCSKQPLTNKQQVIANIIADDNRVLFSIDIYSESLTIFKNNKNYFDDIVEFSGKNNLTTAVMATVVREFPINKCSSDMNIISWFVRIDDFEDTGYIDLFSYNDETIYEWSHEDYKGVWVNVKLNFNTRKIYINNVETDDFAKDKQITHLFALGQTISNLFSGELNNETIELTINSLTIDLSEDEIIYE